MGGAGDVVSTAEGAIFAWISSDQGGKEWWEEKEVTKLLQLVFTLLTLIYSASSSYDFVLPEAFHIEH